MNPGPPATPTIPLSVAQEGLYYHCAMNPRGLAYHEVVSLRRDGPLDGAALEAALAEVVGRHDSLRSCFPTAGGSPVLHINEHRPAPLLALDLSSLSGREAASRAATVVADLARAPYALDRGPLLRPLLVHFPGEHHRLYLAMHHLIFDGVSLSRVLLPDLAALYQARREGHHLPLAPAPSYSDYARWQQGWMEGERAQRRLAYWRHHLSEVPPGPLPWDRDRREGAKGGAGAVPVSVDAATAGRLGEVAGHAGASFFQVMAATWALLLARYAGSGAAVFATAADLRQRAAFDNLVGYCLTPIPLRV
ncbi:MAG TPA: condensation domain-containing protein, partial [Acidimicrobiales bacterium]|nr:condensation domain-containing protein [Acidimicrobiales bacterium]